MRPPLNVFYIAELNGLLNFNVFKEVKVLLVVMVVRVGAGEGDLALLALARLVVVVDVLLHLQRALQYLAARRTRLKETTKIMTKL